jgi:hypothetical protein
LKIFLRNTSLLILLLLAALPFLSAVYLQVRQDHIKNRMKEKLRESFLTTITLGKNEVHWIEKGKEILVNGRLFDIRSFQVSGTHIIFTGLFDDEETNLVYTLKQSEEQNTAFEDEVICSLFQFLQSVYDAPQEEDLCFLNTANYCQQKELMTLPAVYLGILTPPPQS